MKTTFKIMIFGLLSLISNGLYAQDETIIDFYKLKDTAIIICGNLDVKIRSTLAKDGSLKIKADTTLPIMNATFTGYDPLPSNTDPLRYYLNPEITATPFLLNLTTRHKLSNSLIYQFSRSVIIHELVHYLQISSSNKYFTPSSSDSIEIRKYYSQKDELEAMAVQYYFMIGKRKKDELIKIMNLECTIDDKKKLLVDKYLSMVNPNRIFFVFPETVSKYKEIFTK
jgi:hypothetical protein